MKKTICLFLTLCLFLSSTAFVIVSGASAATEFYVSPDGSDTNEGSIARPFKSLERAKSAARMAVRTGPVTVYFREGEYYFSSTTTLGEADSGRADAPIVYQAYPGETVKFEGGISVEGRDFQPVTNKTALETLPLSAAGSVVCLDLNKYGLKDFNVSFAGINPALVEVFYNNQVMQISRYPNKGMLHTGTPLDQGLGAHPGYEFEYLDDYILNWANVKNAWIMGYFAWDWASLYARLDRVDTIKRSIRLDRHDPYGVLENKPWYIFNLLRELDSPGEYFIDADTNMLYFYPPEQGASSESFQHASIQIGLMEGYMLSMNNVEHVTFKDIIFENTRGSGIEVSKTCRNISLIGLTLRNISSLGLWFGGYDCILSGSDIYSIGGGAIYADGGDRKTLTPSNNLIVNNRIHDWGRILRENNAALRMKGCGDIVRRNEIFDGPHLAISVGGNECIVEYNEVYKVIMDGSTDAGLFYNAQDLSALGNTLRYNYFHDHPASFATVYLDDYTSGTEIYGNVLKNVRQGLFIHDGMFNTYRDNVLINARKTGAISGSPIRNWFTVSDVTEASSPIRYFLYLWPWDSGAWAEKYYFLKDIFDPKNEYKAIGNKVYRNFSINVEDGPEFELTGRTATSNIVEAYDNYAVDEYTEEALRAKIPDFEMLDMSKVGIYLDDVRTELPELGNFGLVRPANKSKNIEGREVEFVWQKAENARFYHFKLAKDAEFTDMVVDKTVEATEITVRNLDYAQTRYYWKVEAISDIGLAVKEAVVRSDEEYFTLSTKQYEDVVTGDAEKELETWREFLTQVVEGENGGEFFPGTKKGMEEQIERFENRLTEKKLTQNKLNAALSSFKTQMGIYARMRNAQTLLINDLLYQGYWSFEPNSIVFSETGGIWSGGPTGGLKLRRLENYEVLKFRAQFNYNSSWQGFAIRSSSVEGVAWSGLDQYLVIIKPDILEFQKWKTTGPGGNLLIEYPNDYIKPGETHLYELGALDQPDGSVLFTLKIDGETIIEYRDAENPIVKEGYLELYNTGAGDTIHILPVN